MSIEQSVVNDVVDVKKAITDNWEDILATADSIEKLIKDGLDRIQDPHYKEAINDAINSVLNTLENDLDLSTIEQDFDQAVGSVEAELSQYLDPMLAQLKNIEEDMKPEELFKLLENSMPDIPGMSEVTEGLEEVLSPTKRIIQELLKESFSIKLKDLPLPASATQTDSANGDSSLFEVLTSGLDTHLDTLFSKHGDTIESLLTNFFGLIDKDVTTSLENNTKDLVTQFESGSIDTKTLMNSLKTLIINEGETAKHIGAQFVHNIKGDINSFGQIMEDLLFDDICKNPLTETDKDSLVEIYKTLTDKDECSLVGLLSIVIAIPITIIEKNASLIINGVDKSLFQSVDGKLVTYGVMQLIDGLDMTIDNFPNALDSWDKYFSEDSPVNSYSWFSLLISSISTISNIVAQGVSYPSTNDSFQIVVWSYQWLFVLHGFTEIVIYWNLFKEANLLGEIEQLKKIKEGLNSITNTDDEVNTEKEKIDEEISEKEKKLNSYKKNKSFRKAVETETNLSEIAICRIEIALEIIHFVLFIYLTIHENKNNIDTTTWQQVCYFLDPIPGIIGSNYDIKSIEADLKNVVEEKRNAAIKGIISDLIPQAIYGSLYCGYGANQ